MGLIFSSTKGMTPLASTPVVPPIALESAEDQSVVIENRMAKNLGAKEARGNVEYVGVEQGGTIKEKRERTKSHKQKRHKAGKERKRPDALEV